MTNSTTNTDNPADLPVATAATVARKEAPGIRPATDVPAVPESAAAKNGLPEDGTMESAELSEEDLLLISFTNC